MGAREHRSAPSPDLSTAFLTEWLLPTTGSFWNASPRVFSVETQWLSSFRSYGLLERVENILAVTGSRRWSSSRMPGGLVYSQAAFFLETCAGRRYIFFSSPSACRCAYLILYPIFAMSTVCSVFRAQRHRCQTT